jgi:hypothetical protein
MNGLSKMKDNSGMFEKTAIIRHCAGALMLAALCANPAHAQEAAPLQCGMPSEPPAADAGAEPRMRTWSGRDSWTPPGCIGWSAPKNGVVVALSGRFRHEGTAEDLLRRLGAISSLRGLRYWSVSDKAWRVLITDASLIVTGDAGTRRADLQPREIVSGRAYEFVQSDSRSSTEVRYRLRVIEANPDRVVVVTENAIAVRVFLFTLFDPGELRSAYFFENRGNGTWGLYAVSAAAGSEAERNPASIINRAAAFYRHFSGTKPDARPPMAP